MLKKWTKDYEFENIYEFVENNEIVPSMEDMLADLADDEELPDGVVRITMEFIPREELKG